MESKLLRARRSRELRKVQQASCASRAATSTPSRTFASSDVAGCLLEGGIAQAKRSRQLKLEARATRQKFPCMRSQRILQRAEHKVNQPKRFNTSNRILKNAVRNYATKGMQENRGNYAWL